MVVFACFISEIKYIVFHSKRDFFANGFTYSRLVTISLYLLL